MKINSEIKQVELYDSIKFSEGKIFILFKELDEFTKRNVNLKDGKICSRCFKAHISRVSKNLGLPDDVRDSIMGAFFGEAGHGDYYLDGTEVRFLDG